ncbi:MAG: hypothetical protein WBG50_09030 [Desulfomonilaceae bacterium]
MDFSHNETRTVGFYTMIVLLGTCWLVASGCQEVDTLKRELLKRAQSKILHNKTPFTPRDGITIRTTSLYETANENSPVIIKLPAETSIHLLDKVGEYYRARMRDGREGYLKQKVIGGQDIIDKTQELRRSIEGVPPQAEGVIHSKANFRLEPGRQYEVIEILPPGKKFEVYERVVSLRRPNSPAVKLAQKGMPGSQSLSLEDDAPAMDDASDEQVKKDVWYKVKIEDGRVGYIYTHNMRLTPPEDIARAVPFMRMMGWRTVSTIDDPDQGAKNNYIVAYAPIGRDPGCDYTKLYFMTWSTKLKRRAINWQLAISGVLPVTNFRFDRKPGFSIRSLHPSKRDKLVLTNFVIVRGHVRKVSEEEIPNTARIH